jgi:HK97 family phage major capsid protein
MNEEMTIRKALDIASAGAYLIPEVVDGSIRDYISKEPVLYNVFPKVPWATNTYFIRKRTANPTASWGTDGGSLPSATQSTFTKVSKAIKYLYTRGEVTGPLQRAAGSLFNALAMEVEAHSRVMVEQLSTDLATGNGGAGDEIEGVLYQTDTGTDLNAGGGLLASGAALTLNLVDQAIDNSRGDVDLIVTSRKVRRKLASLLQAQQRFTTTEVAAGFRVLSYDDLPIVTDLHWETGTDMVFVRRSDCKVLVHQDFTYEDLAKTKDSSDFFIKWYGGFAVEGRPTHLTFNDVGSI